MKTVLSLFILATLLGCALVCSTLKLVVQKSGEELSASVQQQDIISSHRQLHKAAQPFAGARPPESRTLALLYPKGFFGGYRNQVIRLVAFCVHAKRNRIQQLLLPSLLWSTKIGNDTFPIPMEWVFDVDYWNEQARNDSRKILPTLVENVHRNQSSDCYWKKRSSDSIAGDSISLTATVSNVDRIQLSSLNPLQVAALQAGSLSPISDITTAAIAGVWEGAKKKRLDLFPTVQDCTAPFVYGGGFRAGRLWNLYVSFRKRAERSLLGQDGTHASLDPGHVIPYHLDKLVSNALRPAKKWRQLAEQCVRRHTAGQQYVALHARIEVDIMAHRCGKTMEFNLTRIVDQVRDFVVEEQKHDSTHETSGIFIAVGRSGMLVDDSVTNERFRMLAMENLVTLDRLVGSTATPGTGVTIDDHSAMPVFECGAHILREFYADHPEVPDHGSLLQSVINFYIAVNAPVFIGVDGSSYSTDIMRTRYYLRKGDKNYQYTSHGRIEPVVGLPLPHSNCEPLNPAKAKNKASSPTRNRKRRRAKTKTTDISSLVSDNKK